MEHKGHILFPTVEYGIHLEGNNILSVNTTYQDNHNNHKASNGYHTHDPRYPTPQSAGKQSDWSNTNKTEVQPPLTCTTIIFQCLFGHAPYVSEILTEKQANRKWSPIIAIEIILRSISQVILVSNPLSGFLIFIAMLISTPSTAALALISLCSGIITAIWIVRIPLATVRSGAITFNCFLLGIVVGEVASNNILSESPWGIILVSITCGGITIVVWCGIQRIVSTFGLPVLNAPVNFLAFVYITCGLANRLERSLPEMLAEGASVPPNSQEIYTQLNDSNSSMPYFTNPNQVPANQLPDENNEFIWRKVAGGVFYAVNQVYGTKTPVTATMIYVAIIIYSPIMFAQAVIGAAIGTLIGMGLSGPPFTTIYNGGWGYNSLLTSASIGGLFLILNFHSWLIACVGSILTALVYSALEKGGQPILGLPFMMMTWLILPVVFNHSHQQSEKGVDCGENDSSPIFCQAISQVPLCEITTPEIHLQSKAKYNRPWKNSIGPSTSSA